MTKRLDGPQIKHNNVDTPYAAVEPLVKVLPVETQFIEPCAGAGWLVTHLGANGHDCVLATDIEPRVAWVDRRDALEMHYEMVRLTGATHIITNPPAEWKILQPLLCKWLDTGLEVWLLLPIDFITHVRFRPFLPHVFHLAVIGRVKWIDDSKTTSTDAFAWYGFSATNNQQWVTA